jgi:hypothetical protein
VAWNYRAVFNNPCQFCPLWWGQMNAHCSETIGLLGNQLELPGYHTQSHFSHSSIICRYQAALTGYLVSYITINKCLDSGKTKCMTTQCNATRCDINTHLYTEKTSPMITSCNVTRCDIDTYLDTGKTAHIVASDNPTRHDINTQLNTEEDNTHCYMWPTDTSVMWRFWFHLTAVDTFRGITTWESIWIVEDTYKQLHTIGLWANLSFATLWKDAVKKWDSKSFHRTKPKCSWSLNLKP